MATTTTNFGWDIPQSTDLVKDGATAIAALGQDIDTALVDLKGGTTGQVLAKATNTDLDFTWVAQDDSNAIQNAIVDAKGDLIAATAADTPARLAVGTNGQVLTADSTAATGLKWATAASGGLTLITNQTFSSSSAVNVNDVFSSTYRNYKVIMEITSANPTPGSNGINMRMRVSGTDNSSANYFSDRVFGQNTSVASQGNTSAATSFAAVLEYETGTSNGVYDFIAPFETANTAITGLNQFRYASYYQHTTMLTGQLTVNTSYTGFSLIPASGTISGRVLVYGYAN